MSEQIFAMGFTYSSASSGCEELKDRQWNFNCFSCAPIRLYAEQIEMFAEDVSPMHVHFIAL